jgi:hypothetical protein
VNSTKHQKISKEKSRSKKKIADLEQQLLSQWQIYLELEKEEAGLASLSTDATTNEHARNDSQHIIMVLDGRVVSIPCRDILYLTDILGAIAESNQSTTDLTTAKKKKEDTDDRIELSKINGTNYLLGTFGAKQFPVPPGVSCVPTNQWQQFAKARQQMKRLYKRMRKKKCTFSREALAYMTAGLHVNSGGSDEAAVDIGCCFFRALFHDMGIPQKKITNLMTARAFPSRETIRQQELIFGGNCFICICYKIAMDGTETVSWQFDHGKRKGIEHFVKQVSWGCFNEEGERIVKVACVDSRMCCHTSEESAKSIRDVANLLKL